MSNSLSKFERAIVDPPFRAHAKDLPLILCEEHNLRKSDDIVPTPNPRENRLVTRKDICPEKACRQVRLCILKQSHLGPAGRAWWFLRNGVLELGMCA